MALSLLGCGSSKVEIPFGEGEADNKEYTKIEKELQEVGFTNIELRPWGLSPEDEEKGAFQGAVMYVSIEDVDNYEKGDRFDADIPITIGYYIDNMTKVPKSSDDCKGKPYEDIVRLFEDVGYLYVFPTAYEIENIAGISEDSVVAVLIQESANEYIQDFTEESEFNADKFVYVYYASFPEGTEESAVTGESASTTNGKTTEDEGALVWVTQR